MNPAVTKKEAQKLLGKNIYALKRDGSFITGKLVRIKGNELFLKSNTRKVSTNAILPLVLFDLLAIGTYGGYGGYGYPYGGYGGFGGYGYGYPGFY